LILVVGSLTLIPHSVLAEKIFHKPGGNYHSCEGRGLTQVTLESILNRMANDWQLTPSKETVGPRVDA